MNVDTLFTRVPTERDQELLKVVSRSGVGDILFSLNRAPLRFSQLVFETRLNPGILNRHLKALMRLNIVEKNGDTYELSSSGRQVVRILEQLYSLS